MNSPPPQVQQQQQQQQQAQTSSDSETSKCNESSDNKSDNGANTKNSDEELKEQQQQQVVAATEPTPSTSSSSSLPSLPLNTNAYSSRNDLIRDIESHIEIIFECFELDDSATTSTAAPPVMSPVEASIADIPNEVATISEVSQDVAEKSGEKITTGAAAAAEEKNELEKKSE
jgi:hypothetical protein